MSQSISLAELKQRVYRESLQDGILEIMVGALLYLGGIFVADIEVGVIFVVWLGFIPRALETAKERFTYPRLGRVVLQQGKPGPLLTGALLYAFAAFGIVTLALATLGHLTTAAWFKWLPVPVGLCLLGAFSQIYAKSGSLRFLVYGLAALGAGIAIGSLRLPTLKDNLAVYLICMGALSALTGAVMLARFVRSHPVSAHEVPDDHDHR